MWNYFFRVCVLNRTSVYLHLIVYVIDQLRTVFFILAWKLAINLVSRENFQLKNTFTAVLQLSQKAAINFDMPTINVKNRLGGLAQMDETKKEY